MIEDDFFVSIIKPDWVDKFWPVIEKSVTDAIEHSNGELDIDVLKSQIKDGRIYLLVVTDVQGNVYASSTMEQREFESGKKVLNITTTGGSGMEHWVHKVIEAAKGLADQLGCDEVYIVGRLGWTRVLKPLGFKPVHQVLSMRIH